MTGNLIFLLALPVLPGSKAVLEEWTISSYTSETPPEGCTHEKILLSRQKSLPSLLTKANRSESAGATWPLVHVLL